MNNLFSQSASSRASLSNRYAILHSALTNELRYCEASCESYSSLGFHDRSYQCTLIDLADRYARIVDELEGIVSDDRWFELVFRSGVTK